MKVFRWFTIVFVSLVGFFGGGALGNYTYNHWIRVEEPTLNVPFTPAEKPKDEEETLPPAEEQKPSNPSEEVPPKEEPDEEPDENNPEEVPPVEEPSEPQRLMGDVDNNGVIDKEDLSLIQKEMLNSATLAEEDIPYADINHNGEVDLQDCQYVMMYISGSIDTLEGIGLSNEETGA